MRKRILCLLLAALLLGGCGRGEDPYRVDTVIRIPANPTEEPATEIQTDPPETAATAAPSELEETSEETIAEESTAAPTEPEETKASSTGTKNSGKKSGKTNKTNKNNKTDKATEPEETKPKATEPEETKPVPTQPPATEPAVTEPPATEPAETQPPETVPAETEISTTEPPATEPEGFDLSDYVPDNLQYEMLAKLNEARTDFGVGELPLDEKLSAICAVRAWEVCQVWSHTRPDGRGYATILSDYGYSASATGELLVYVTGSGDAASIVGKWMESDSHREMILGEGYRSFGIGIYRANGYTFVCCMVVG